jgi:hypothetical protein
MNNQQIGAGIDGEFDGGRRTIHSGGDFCDRARIFHLQAVDSALPI